MPEIRDIKPTGPTWQKRRIEENGPRPEDRPKRKPNPESAEDEDKPDKPRDGQIDEYA